MKIYDEPVVQRLSLVGVVHKCFSFIVFTKIRQLVSLIALFYTCYFGALDSLVLILSLNSVLKAVFRPIIVFVLHIVILVENFLSGTRTTYSYYDHINDNSYITI